MSGKVSLDELKAMLEVPGAEWREVKREAAERFGCHPDSVQRAARQARLIEPRVHRTLTDEEWGQVMWLAQTGMPATWIAETVGVRYGSLKDVLPPRPQAAAQWRSVWHSILKDPALLALHREFAPPPSRIQRYYQEAA